MDRAIAVEGSHPIRIAHRARVRNGEGVRRSTEPVESPFGRGVECPQDPDLAVEHDLRCGHAGHQRKLRVPVFDRPHGSVHDLVVIADVDDLLGREIEAHPATILLERQPQASYLAEQEMTGIGVLPRQIVRNLLIGASGSIAHHGSFQIRVDEAAAGIELKGPEQRRRVLVGEQRCCTGAEHLGMQRRVDVGGIEREASLLCRQVEGARRSDEGTHVGDRIVDEVAVAMASGGERLVEITAPGRIDRDEIEVPSVHSIVSGGGPIGVCEHIRGEVDDDLELGPDPREPLVERSFGRAGELEAGHGSRTLVANDRLAALSAAPTNGCRSLRPGEWGLGAEGPRADQ